MKNTKELKMVLTAMLLLIAFMAWKSYRLQVRVERLEAAVATEAR